MPFLDHDFVVEITLPFLAHAQLAVLARCSLPAFRKVEARVAREVRTDRVLLVLQTLARASRRRFAAGTGTGLQRDVDGSLETYMERTEPSSVHHHWTLRSALPREARRISHVAVGLHFALASSTDLGRVFSWGSDDHGELGRRTSQGGQKSNNGAGGSVYSAPGPIPWLDGVAVTSLCAAESTACCVGDGHLYKWGRAFGCADEYSRADDEEEEEEEEDDDDYSDSDSSFPVVVAAAKERREIPVWEESTSRPYLLTAALGNTFGVATDAEGALWRFGRSGFRTPRVAEGGRDDSLVRLDWPREVVEVDVGDAHALVLTQSGRLFAFGSNATSECSPDDDRWWIDDPVELRKLPPLYSIHAVGPASFAVAALDGEVLGWGQDFKDVTRAARALPLAARTDASVTVHFRDSALRRRQQQQQQQQQHYVSSRKQPKRRGSSLWRRIVDAVIFGAKGTHAKCAPVLPGTPTTMLHTTDHHHHDPPDGSLVLGQLLDRMSRDALAAQARGSLS